MLKEWTMKMERINNVCMYVCTGVVCVEFIENYTRIKINYVRNQYRGNMLCR